ncbi:MAG TPA: hypothetical protein VJ937_00045 [Salinivirga sp.]|uniref:tetratricopeptide repeat protein n=1 Tax=Salinivirga sp. TaxID=1970192 RepID=UPI002B48898C|nr:hypothetical protein [Salinivirga sp.]HKK57837.1 hypothetical protein [Salinivirga sp.]
MRAFFVLLIVAFLGLSMYNGCKRNQEQTLSEKIAHKEQALSKISAKRPLNKKEVKSLLTLYEKFYKENPKDTLAAAFIINAAQDAMQSQMYQKALHYYDIVETDFVNTAHYPMAIFMKAFVYDQTMDTAHARIYYNKFIEKFPGHKLTDDAQISLLNPGKSAKEFVTSFEKQQQPE